MKVNAVVYFRVVDSRNAIVEVENFLYATSQLSQTTLRSVLGEVILDELLSQREKLNLRLQEILDQHTDPWGIKVSMVEIKGVDLPEVMQRAMARQAEAEREKRAKIIHASGEFEASARLADAAKIIATEPVSLQLRYLQTLTEIGLERNSTIVFPLPIDMITFFQEAMEKQRGGQGINGRGDLLGRGRDSRWRSSSPLSSCVRSFSSWECWQAEVRSPSTRFPRPLTKRSFCPRGRRIPKIRI